MEHSAGGARWSGLGRTTSLGLTEVSSVTCPSGTHDITLTTLWWWAAYPAPRSGSTLATSGGGGRCHSDRLRSPRGSMGYLRPYGGQCQNLTRGIGTKTHGYPGRRGDLLTIEYPHEGGWELKRGFGGWAAPYGQAYRAIGNGAWRPRERMWRHCWGGTRQMQRSHGDR